jgi:hypothetical protein
VNPDQVKGIAEYSSCRVSSMMGIEKLVAVYDSTGSSFAGDIVIAVVISGRRIDI